MKNPVLKKMMERKTSKAPNKKALIRKVVQKQKKTIIELAKV